MKCTMGGESTEEIMFTLLSYDVENLQCVIYLDVLCLYFQSSIFTHYNSMLLGIYILVLELIKQHTHTQGLLRGLAVACWITDRYHPCSNLDVGISEGCFILDFASLPLQVARPI